MFVVLLNMILSSIILIIIVCAVLILTVSAIALIIVSCVRSSKAKKRGQKTGKAGLKAGIAMLVAPWVLVLFAVGFAAIFNKAINKWDFRDDQAAVAEAIANQDADALYEFMSPYMMEENDLTEEDLQEFLDRCNITNNTSDDLYRYNNQGEHEDPLDCSSFHYRPDGNEFSYTMYYVNDEGAQVCVSGIRSDFSDKDKVGICYIEYREKKPDNPYKWQTVDEFGEKPS